MKNCKQVVVSHSNSLSLGLTSYSIPALPSQALLPPTGQFLCKSISLSQVFSKIKIRGRGFVLKTYKQSLCYASGNRIFQCSFGTRSAWLLLFCSTVVGFCLLAFLGGLRGVCLFDHVLTIVFKVRCECQNRKFMDAHLEYKNISNPELLTYLSCLVYICGVYHKIAECFRYEDSLIH